MVSTVLFLSFFVFLILNVPIAICLGLSSVCAILYSGTSLTIVATNVYSGISKFLLLAIPFFVLSGNIMAKAGISRRLIKFVNTCVGHRRGGIAIVCVIVACFFGAISGSGPATVAALGAVLIPAMVEEGRFSAPFSTALMATSSSIAIVIPPSIAFVVYASITGVSIADMFSGGIVPGILMGLALVIVVMIEVRKKGIQPTMEKASWKERMKAFGDAFWGFLMPVIILGGIYGGIFTPTEAAAVSVVYGLFVGMVIYREVKWRDLVDIFVDSAKTTGGIMLIVACASLFSYVCTQFGISTAASNLLSAVAHNQFTFLLIVNVIFLIAGCFIDANSAMYIFIPIMLPVCKALGYDLVAFGVMATVNLAIGQVTPPVGVNLFVAISMKIKKGMEVTLQQISRAVVPMIAASVAVLLLITYVPKISTFLPEVLAGSSYTGKVAEGSAESSKDPMEDAAFNQIEDYSDLGWEEQTWNFTCSTTENSTWSEAGEHFGKLMEEATGGKVHVAVYAADQLTNSQRPVTCAEDMKNLKIRVAGSNLLTQCYKLWGADATNMNWSETYTALQQGTVDGQENPLPAIDAASVQEVQQYCSMWNSIYDCLFFCINQELYDSLTPEQQKVVDEAGKKAVEYERYINRAGDEEILKRWAEEDGVEILPGEALDMDSFQKAVEGIPQWFEEELISQGYDPEEVKELIQAFREE